MYASRSERIAIEIKSPPSTQTCYPLYANDMYVCVRGNRLSRKTSRGRSLLATSRSSRSSGKATGMLQNKALSSMDGCGGAREQHQQQRRKRQDAASSRHATTTATPAPSYSSMLAARRSITSAVGVPSQEVSAAIDRRAVKNVCFFSQFLKSMVISACPPRWVLP